MTARILWNLALFALITVTVDRALDYLDRRVDQWAADNGYRRPR